MNDDAPSTHRPPERNLGQTAFSAMGWLELVVSVVLFILDVHLAAAIFGIAAIFMTLISISVKRQRYDLPRDRARRGEHGVRQRSGTAYWIQLGLCAALTLAAGLSLFLGNLSFAGVFVIWALTFGLFANRAAVPPGIKG